MGIASGLLKAPFESDPVGAQPVAAGVIQGDFVTAFWDWEGDGFVVLAGLGIVFVVEVGEGEGLDGLAVDAPFEAGAESGDGADVDLKAALARGVHQEGRRVAQFGVQHALDRATQVAGVLDGAVRQDAELGAPGGLPLAGEDGARGVAQGVDAHGGIEGEDRDVVGGEVAEGDFQFAANHLAGGGALAREIGGDDGGARRDAVQGQRDGDLLLESQGVIGEVAVHGVEDDGAAVGAGPGGQAQVGGCGTRGFGAEEVGTEVKVAVGAVEGALACDRGQGAVALGVAAHRAQDGEGEEGAGGVELGAGGAHPDLALARGDGQPGEGRGAEAPIVEEDDRDAAPGQDAAALDHGVPGGELVLGQVDVAVLGAPLPPDAEDLEIDVLGEAVAAEQDGTALLGGVGADAVGEGVPGAVVAPEAEGLPERSEGVGGLGGLFEEVVDAQEGAVVEGGDRAAGAEGGVGEVDVVEGGPARVGGGEAAGLGAGGGEVEAEVGEGGVVVTLAGAEGGVDLVHEEVVGAGVDLLAAPAEEVVLVGGAGERAVTDATLAPGVEEVATGTAGGHLEKLGAGEAVLAVVEGAAGDAAAEEGAEGVGLVGKRVQPVHARGLAPLEPAADEKLGAGLAGHVQGARVVGHLGHGEDDRAVKRGVRSGERGDGRQDEEDEGEEGGFHGESFD